MTKGFKTLDDIGDVRGKRVLVREDLNVPMADGAVTDDTRLRATLPTVTELADKGAIVLVLAHFGRPRANPIPNCRWRASRGPLRRCSAARCATSIGKGTRPRSPRSRRATSPSWRIRPSSPAPTRTTQKSLKPLPLPA